MLVLSCRSSSPTLLLSVLINQSSNPVSSPAPASSGCCSCKVCPVHPIHPELDVRCPGSGETSCAVRKRGPKRLLTGASCGRVSARVAAFGKRGFEVLQRTRWYVYLLIKKDVRLQIGEYTEILR